MKFESSELIADRLEVMDKLLMPFHGHLGSLLDLHRRLAERDPDFYGRLATWNLRHGTARPETFVATLLTSPSSTSPQHRDAGFELLQDLAPSQVSRVVKLLKRHIGKTPRSTRAAVILYLRNLEENPARFDAAVRCARRSLKHLYASLHIRPSERADRILFKRAATPAPGPVDGAPFGTSPSSSGIAPGAPIRRATALLVDKSAGMEDALVLGERLAVDLSDRMAPSVELDVYLFDRVPYLVEPKTGDAEAWHDGFRHYTAAGSMSAGSVLEALRQKRRAVEQLVVVTGRDEDGTPAFADMYETYAAQVGVHPDVHVVATAEGASLFVARLESAGIPVSTLTVPQGPSFCLGSALDLWSRPSRREQLDEILSVRLPTRRAA